MPFKGHRWEPFHSEPLASFPSPAPGSWGRLIRAKREAEIFPYIITSSNLTPGGPEKTLELLSQWARA